MDQNNIRIGIRKGVNDGYYAFDPDLQVGKEKHIFLFDFNLMSPQLFNRKNLGEYFTPLNNKQVKRKLINSYLLWKNDKLEKFLRVHAVNKSFICKNKKLSNQDGAKSLQYLKEKLLDYGIDSFFHFTDQNNLDSILAMGGLYSWKYLQSTNIHVPFPGGNDQSRKVDLRKGLDNYVHLSFNDNPPMVHVAQREARIPNPIILVIDKSIIDSSEFLLSTKNAIDNSAVIGNQREVIDEIRFDIITRSWKNEEEKRLFQAELMIRECIPSDYFLEIRQF